MTAFQVVEWSAPYCVIDYEKLITHVADWVDPESITDDAIDCRCEPCPGRGNDGHAMTHCAECCFGSGVDADIDCPIHGDKSITEPERTATACNALRCRCIEWADGPMIAGYPSCHVCSHTKASHKPKGQTKKAKR